MNPSEKHVESPKIVVMNITPAVIPNTIKNTIHGVKENTAAASVAEKLERGDVCIIRQISQESRYKNGATRIWYYCDKEDIEGKVEPLWRPSTGWKYKLFMKPLVKQFAEPFFEEFSAVVPGQDQIKKSLKVDGLLFTDIQGDVQGAITIDFRESELPKRYLKAIIEEKKEECNIQVVYEDIDGNKTKVNLYEFLTDLTGDASYVKPDRGDQSRRAPGPARQRRVQKLPTIDRDIEIDEAQKIEKTNAGLAFCPKCGTMLRPMPGKSGIPVYFCKECNKGYRVNSK